jgi:phenylacetate-coenzyme A ligase PaaK-like adenylate-forming protein
VPPWRAYLYHTLGSKDASDRIHKALHVRLNCTPVAPNTLPRFELKTKRIIDQRPKELRRALDR